MPFIPINHDRTVEHEDTRIPLPLFNSFRILYRRFYPMLKTPVAATDEERLALQYVPPQPLTAKFTSVLSYLQKHSRYPIGDYFEFGVYNGTSMSCMNAALMALGLDHVKLIGFDSFLGLPREVESDDGGVWSAGLFSCPKDYTIQNLRSKNVDMNRVQFVEGWYKDTLSSSYPISLISTRASVVMIDCDAYSSAVLALNFISPFLSDISAIFFDDWRLNDLDVKGMGEYRAFSEFLLSHEQEFAVIGFGKYNRKSRVFIVKMRDQNASFIRRLYETLITKCSVRW
jgi:O-methyltransferase